CDLTVTVDRLAKQLRTPGRLKMSGNWKLAIMVGLVTLAGTFAAQSAESADEALVKALPGAKITLLQGIAQVAKGTEVPTEAKYEMEDGKLMLSVYTSAKGFDTAAEDNSFNEYGGDATAAAWTPKKEVFTDLKHIARSAQYHTLLSMTKWAFRQSSRRPRRRAKSCPLGRKFAAASLSSR